ncbi:phage regulatory protein/antirepressor Ant [Photobacterium iliopiscarium]|uniref:phage regulatory protein/antirepressor Ant n=1 Tax=Photobacterium iliopiscarium TaxID=56192 RepID=UPI00242C7709|nr:phage regulatory protein/antirepressor Ant [Photobacterium iliopiscarium]
MNTIVTLNESQCPVTTSMIIAEHVGLQHKNVLSIIRENINDFNEFGNTAFETRNSIGAGRPTEYAILNEQHATLLITYMRNSEVVKKFKKTLVKAFFDMRNEFNNRQASVGDLSRMDILKLAMQSEEERLRLQQENKGLELRIEADVPKVAFAEKVSIAPDAISVAQAAKILGTGQRRLFAFLRQQHWVSRHNEPYQAKIEQGLLDVKISDWSHPTQGLQKSVTTLVTGKGLSKLQLIHH